ncbi:MAG: ABC transporter permease [Anaerolineae bacterium]|nr:ABC transporter permease [Anaerolineae bacterium]
MFAQITSLTRKELALWLKRPGQWIVIFLVPFAFIAIFTAVFGGSDIPRVAIYLANEDTGAPARRVVESLRASANLEVTELSSRAEADRLVGEEKRMTAVVIPAGFSQAVEAGSGATIQLIVDPAQNERAAIVNGLVTEALSGLIVDAEVTRGVNDGVGAFIDSTGNDTETPEIRGFLVAAMKGIVSAQAQEAVDNPLIRVSRQSAADARATRPPTLLESLVPGYSLMFVFYLVSMMAVTVVDERQTGTLRRLLILPVRRWVILFGKALPFFLIALAQISAVLLVSTLLFDFSLGNHPAALIPILVGTAASVAGLGMFIAALVRSGGQASGLTILVVLVMAAVSGSLFPSIRIPYLEYATPHYWAIQGMQNVMARGMGLEGAWLPSLVLLGAAAVFFTLGVLRFRFDD